MIPLRDNIPSASTPVVNYVLIGACVAAFGLQMSSPDHLQQWAFTPHDLISPTQWSQVGWPRILWTLATAMFLHGGLGHLASNMLPLWVFGDNVEDRMGHVRYLGFYLLCGIIATLAHSLFSGFSDTPILGASGAIAGVLGAYFVLFKGAYVRTLVPLFFVFTIMDIPAVVFLGLWFILQLLGVFGSSGGGVAFWAHIGGFLAGAWLVRYFAMGRSRAPRPRVIDVRYD